MNYQDIKSIEELYDFLNTFKYGIKVGESVYYNDDVNEHINKWHLQSVEDIVKNKIGICYDFVEVERDWFLRQGYHCLTIFLIFAVDYENNYPTHTLLAYEHQNKWYHFEVADYLHQGIHEYTSLDELINQVMINQINYANLNNSEIKNKLKVYTYDTPKLNCSFIEYIDSIIDNGMLQNKR